MRHNARLLSISDPAELAEEMRRVGAEPEGIGRMLPKALTYLVKIENVRIPLAHILKESFLSAGGDAVVSRDVITGRTERTPIILIGNRKQFNAVMRGLEAQKFGAKALAAEISSAIHQYEADASALPADLDVGERSRRMFDTMSRRTLIMGILNVTPDSFSDGGSYLNHHAAADHAVRMISEGADIVDIGGESTRPGSEPVSADEEIARIIPVIEQLRTKSDVVISVDTWKSSVARAALRNGADMVNDISGMSFDPEMARVVAERRAPASLMHIKGTPKDMQVNPAYEDLMSEVTEYLRQRIERAVEAGVDIRLLIVDPGFGFGKTMEHNLTLLRRLRELKSLGRPILVGTSRKSTVGKVLGDLPADERLEGTAATVAASIMNGANIVRVHDVKEMTRVAQMTDAILGNRLVQREEKT